MRSPTNDTSRNIAGIKEFGAMLLSTRKSTSVLAKTGAALQPLIPGAVLLITRPTKTSLRIHWQCGLEPRLNRIYARLRGDPMHMAFPLCKEPEHLSWLYDNQLHQLNGGSRALCRRAIPERLVSILEEMMEIEAIHLIGFSWARVHYATLAILLPKGAHLVNKDAVETHVLLASGTLMRLEVEHELRESATQYRKLIEDSAEAIGVSQGNRVVYANPALLKLLGYDSLEALTRAPLLEHVAPESREAVLARMQGRDQKAAVPSKHEHRIIRKDGAIRTIIVNSREIVFNDEKCTQTSFHDVTEQKLAAENTAKFRKLESLGILRGGIAHEYNNVFMGILGHMENAKTKIGNASAIWNLNRALGLLDRAKVLTSRLIAFSSGGVPDLKPRPLFPFAEDVLKAVIDHSLFTCSMTRGPHLRRCLYDKGQLCRILLAIIDNAMDAMPAGGRIKLAAANEWMPSDNPAGLTEGKYVRLSISDQGSGIAHETLQQVFSPLFTTKPGGTGLSLAVARSVLKGTGGTIQVQSTPGNGTTFDLFLPAHGE